MRTPEMGAAGTVLAARLFFEDNSLRETALKLARLIEGAASPSRPYFEALGVVLAHELARLNAGVRRREASVRGGLAGWQQRIVSTYIDEHLAEQVPLARLTQLVGLSPYYFCRAFKQSFGLPPRRYHSSRRMDSAGRLRASMDTCCSRTNANDRLPLASLGRVEGGDGVVEGRDVADVRPQSSVTHALDDLTQLGTIGLDNEVDRQAVGGPRLDRSDDGHQCSSGSNQARGPLADVGADDIEHQVDFADVLQSVLVEVDELLRAEVEHRLTVGAAPGADDVGAGLSCELRHHRPDCASRAVREDALPRLEAAMLEQSLPRGQARDRQARAHREVDVARQRREVARLDGRVLRQG